MAEETKTEFPTHTGAIPGMTEGRRVTETRLNHIAIGIAAKKRRDGAPDKPREIIVYGPKNQSSVTRSETRTKRFMTIPAGYPLPIPLERKSAQVEIWDECMKGMQQPCMFCCEIDESVPPIFTLNEMSALQAVYCSQWCWANHVHAFQGKNGRDVRMHGWRFFERLGIEPDEHIFSRATEQRNLRMFCRSDTGDDKCPAAMYGQDPSVFRDPSPRALAKKDETTRKKAEYSFLPTLCCIITKLQPQLRKVVVDDRIRAKTAAAKKRLKKYSKNAMRAAEIAFASAEKEHGEGGGLDDARESGSDRDDDDDDDETGDDEDDDGDDDAESDEESDFKTGKAAAGQVSTNAFHATGMSEKTPDVLRVLASEMLVKTRVREASRKSPWEDVFDDTYLPEDMCLHGSALMPQPCEFCVEFYDGPLPMRVIATRSDGTRFVDHVFCSQFCWRMWCMHNYSSGGWKVLDDGMKTLKRQKVAAQHFEQFIPQHAMRMFQRTIRRTPTENRKITVWGGVNPAPYRGEDPATVQLSYQEEMFVDSVGSCMALDHFEKALEMAGFEGKFREPTEKQRRKQEGDPDAEEANVERRRNRKIMLSVSRSFIDVFDIAVLVWMQNKSDDFRTVASEQQAIRDRLQQCIPDRNLFGGGPVTGLLVPTDAKPFERTSTGKVAVLDFYTDEREAGKSHDEIDITPHVPVNEKKRNVRIPLHIESARKRAQTTARAKTTGKTKRTRAAAAAETAAMSETL